MTHEQTLRQSGEGSSDRQDQLAKGVGEERKGGRCFEDRFLQAAEANDGEGEAMDRECVREA